MVRLEPGGSFISKADIDAGRWLQSFDAIQHENILTKLSQSFCSGNSRTTKVKGMFESDSQTLACGNFDFEEDEAQSKISDAVVEQLTPHLGGSIERTVEDAQESRTHPVKSRRHDSFPANSLSQTVVTFSVPYASTWHFRAMASSQSPGGRFELRKGGGPSGALITAQDLPKFTSHERSWSPALAVKLDAGRHSLVLYSVNVDDGFGRGKLPGGIQYREPYHCAVNDWTELNTESLPCNTTHLEWRRAEDQRLEEDLARRQELYEESMRPAPTVAPAAPTQAYQASAKNRGLNKMNKWADKTGGETMTVDDVDIFGDFEEKRNFFDEMEEDVTFLSHGPDYDGAYFSLSIGFELPGDVMGLLDMVMGDGGIEGAITELVSNNYVAFAFSTFLLGQTRDVMFSAQYGQRGASDNQQNAGLSGFAAYTWTMPAFLAPGTTDAQRSMGIAITVECDDISIDFEGMFQDEADRVYPNFMIGLHVTIGESHMINEIFRWIQEAILLILRGDIVQGIMNAAAELQTWINEKVQEIDRAKNELSKSGFLNSLKAGNNAFFSWLAGGDIDGHKADMEKYKREANEYLTVYYDMSENAVDCTLVWSTLNGKRRQVAHPPGCSQTDVDALRARADVMYNKYVEANNKRLAAQNWLEWPCQTHYTYGLFGERWGPHDNDWWKCGAIRAKQLVDKIMDAIAAAILNVLKAILNIFLDLLNAMLQTWSMLLTQMKAIYKGSDGRWKLDPEGFKNWAATAKPIAITSIDMALEFQGAKMDFTAAIGYQLFSKDAVSPPCNFLDPTELWDTFWAGMKQAFIDFMSVGGNAVSSLFEAVFPSSANLGAGKLHDDEVVASPRHTSLGEWQKNSSMKVWRTMPAEDHAVMAAYHTQSREHDLSKILHAESELVDDVHARFASVIIGGGAAASGDALVEHATVSSTLGAAVVAADDEANMHLAVLFQRGVLKKGAHKRMTEGLADAVSSACAVHTGGGHDSRRHGEHICKGASVAAAVSCASSASSSSSKNAAGAETPRTSTEDSVCAGSLSRLAASSCVASYAPCAEAIIQSMGCSAGCGAAVAALPKTCGGISPRFHHGGFAAHHDEAASTGSAVPCSSAFGVAQQQCRSDADAKCAALLEAAPAGMSHAVAQNLNDEIPLAHSWSEGGARGAVPTSVACKRRVSLLDLSHNHFMGTVPECLTDGTVVPNHVMLHDNRLTGTLPALGEHVHHLNVGRNSLVGDLGDAAHPTGGNLKFVIASHNKFTGSGWIQSVISGSPRLEYLDLAGNDLRLPDDEVGHVSSMGESSDKDVSAPPRAAGASGTRSTALGEALAAAGKLDFYDLDGNRRLLGAPPSPHARPVGVNVAIRVSSTIDSLCVACSRATKGLDWLGEEHHARLNQPCAKASHFGGLCAADGGSAINNLKASITDAACAASVVGVAANAKSCVNDPDRWFFVSVDSLRPLASGADAVGRPDATVAAVTVTPTSLAAAAVAKVGGGDLHAALAASIRALQGGRLGRGGKLAVDAVETQEACPPGHMGPSCNYLCTAAWSRLGRYIDVASIPARDLPIPAASAARHHAVAKSFATMPTPSDRLHNRFEGTPEENADKALQSRYSDLGYGVHHSYAGAGEAYMGHTAHAKCPSSCRYAVIKAKDRCHAWANERSSASSRVKEAKWSECHVSLLSELTAKCGVSEESCAGVKSPTTFEEHEGSGHCQVCGLLNHWLQRGVKDQGVSSEWEPRDFTARANELRKGRSDQVDDMKARVHESSESQMRYDFAAAGLNPDPEEHDHVEEFRVNHLKNRADAQANLGTVSAVMRSQFPTCEVDGATCSKKCRVAMHASVLPACLAAAVGAAKKQSATAVIDECRAAVAHASEVACNGAGERDACVEPLVAGFRDDDGVVLGGAVTVRDEKRRDDDEHSKHDAAAASSLEEKEESPRKRTNAADDESEAVSESSRLGHAEGKHYVDAEERLTSTRTLLAAGREGSSTVVASVVAVSVAGFAFAVFLAFFKNNAALRNDTPSEEHGLLGR